jgi:hypothetical protein
MSLGLHQSSIDKYVVLAKEIQMDLEEILSTIEFPQPTSVKMLQSFLGLVNFSRRFAWHGTAMHTHDRK